MKKRYKLIVLNSLGDARSDMCVCECEKEIPFNIKRIFYDFDTRDGNSDRANHANMNSQFAFICMNGSCEIEVDDGNNKETFVLDKPNKLLIIDKMVWKVMKKFSKDSVLFVASDCHYDKSEYIYAYDEFHDLVSNVGVN